MKDMKVLLFAGLIVFTNAQLLFPPIPQLVRPQLQVFVSNQDVQTNPLNNNGNIENGNIVSPTFRPISQQTQDFNPRPQLNSAAGFDMESNTQLLDFINQFVNGPQTNSTGNGGLNPITQFNQGNNVRSQSTQSFNYSPQGAQPFAFQPNQINRPNSNLGNLNGRAVPFVPFNSNLNIGAVRFNSANLVNQALQARPQPNFNARPQSTQVFTSSSPGNQFTPQAIQPNSNFGGVPLNSVNQNFGGVPLNSVNSNVGGVPFNTVNLVNQALQARQRPAVNSNAIFNNNNNNVGNEDLLNFVRQIQPSQVPAFGSQSNQSIVPQGAQVFRAGSQLIQAVTSRPLTTQVVITPLAALTLTGAEASRLNPNMGNAIGDLGIQSNLLPAAVLVTPHVIEIHKHFVDQYNYDTHEHRLVDTNRNVENVQETHELKKVILQDHLHKHNIHTTNLHLTTVNRENIHENQVNRHNVHVTKIIEPIIHNYNERRQNVIPNQRVEFRVVPAGVTQDVKYTQNVQRGAPIVFNHEIVNGQIQQDSSSVLNSNINNLNPNLNNFNSNANLSPFGANVPLAGTRDLNAGLPLINGFPVRIMESVGREFNLQSRSDNSDTREQPERSQFRIPQEGEEYTIPTSNPR